MLDDIRSLVDDGAAIVVADALAVRQWEAALAGAHEARVWPSSAIVAYDTWARECWSQAGGEALPLGRAQSRALWRATIAASPAAEHLIGVDGAAQWAAAAHHDLRQAGVDPDHLQALGSEPDFAAFLGWYAEYRAALATRGWTDDAQLAADLLSIGAPPPRTLVVAEPLEQSPARSALWAALERGGSRIRHLASLGLHAAAQRIELPDTAAELDAAARWAAEQLHVSPQSRLAVVVPDAAERRFEIEQTFAARLPAHVVWHRVARLTDEPLIGAALDAVELTTPRATFATLSRWLRNPAFAADDADRARRAQAERTLRAHLAAQLPFASGYAAGLGAELRRAAPDAAAALERALGEMRGVRRAAPSRWAQLWQRAARTLGWPPAGTPPDAAEIGQWDRALDAYAALTPIVGTSTASEAFAELEDILTGAAVARALPLAGVHVLAHIDEIGPGYAGAWVTGFTDAYWPQSTRANPLLPQRLQRQHAMPWSSPQDARARSARSLSALFARTPQLVFSWPARLFDSEAEPSPAIAGLPVYELAAYAAAARGEAAAPRRETIVDPAPPLLGHALAGGVAALDTQARCPVRAFCEHRLGASELPSIARGLPAHLQGVAAHRALELLYDSRRTHAAVAQLRSDPDTVERCVERALDAVFGAARRALAAVHALERERLARILRALLDCDAQRAAFRIAAVEERRASVVDGREISIRIDRLDELADGSIAVIDYKTGARVGTTDWFKARLTDTQVPMYAAFAPERVSAAALARLRTDATDYTGVWQTPDSFPSTSKKLPDGRAWDTQLAEWRTQIAALVREYAAGDCRVLGADLDLALGAFAPLTRVLEQVALARGALRPW